tara:strand:+ start:294 stop:503 length:210 start_codon:yes stop_codon:yes gene_type:complete
VSQRQNREGYPESAGGEEVKLKNQKWRSLRKNLSRLGDLFNYAKPARTASYYLKFSASSFYLGALDTAV